MFSGLLALPLSILREAVGPKIYTAALKLRARRIKKPEVFWERFRQLQLLLRRLNDADIESTWCERAGGDATSNYEACCLAYVGLIGLSYKAAVLEARGYELDERWKANLTSATNHFSEHLHAKLDSNDAELFDHFCLAVMVAATNDPEHIPFCDPRVKTNE